MPNINYLTKAYVFAAEKHVKQRRKGVKDIPYINHPIEVANLLSHSNEQVDYSLLIAAILHDTIEDTDTSEKEIEQLFGNNVLNIVLEVTDNMQLSKAERRKKQTNSAPHLSPQAKQIKIADKTCNILDMLTTRIEWTQQMKRDYVKWAISVVDGCRGVNIVLEKEFDKAVKLALNTLGDI